MMMFRKPRFEGHQHHSIGMDTKNVKGSIFWCKFAFNSVVACKDLLTNLVFKIDAIFVCIPQCIIDQLLSMRKGCLSICNKGNIEKHVL